jgi:hypothetical protein
MTEQVAVATEPTTEFTKGKLLPPPIPPSVQQQVKFTRAQIAYIVQQAFPGGVEDALPKSELMHRPGWTRQLIDDILGDADSTPRGPSGYRVQFYNLNRIEFAEQYLPLLTEE